MGHTAKKTRADESTIPDGRTVRARERAGQRGEKRLIGLDCGKEGRCGGRKESGEPADDRFAQARKVLKANFGKFCLSSRGGAR